jgi:flagellar capping protein FliD
MTGNISFSGLFSGLSTNDIISSLVNLRRAPITQLEGLAEQDGFEKTAYQTVNTQILALRKALLSTRLQSTFLTKKVTSSAENVLGVKAGFNAQNGSHNLTIQSIAQGARAISGLNDRALERAAAKLAGGNTLGVTGIAMTSNTLGSTRVTLQTLLQNTQQAGSGTASVTAGDKIKIDVTLKSGGTNSAYFTFAGDATDTVERLRQTMVSAFQGEAQVALDSNGAFVISETNPSGAPVIALNNISFVDSDFSGSTFSVATGPNLAGNTATSRTIVGTRTFTTSASATIANGTETLVSLDQWGGGIPSGDETIQITGTKFDGTAVSSSFAITATTTLNDLITELQTQFNNAPNPPWETVVALENGKLTFRDTATGTSQTSVSLGFVDPGNTLSLSLGGMVTTVSGSADISQKIWTSGMTASAKGVHQVTSTNGRGGVVTGTVSLNANTTLASLGVTDTGLFTIDRDNGTGVVDPVTVFGVTPDNTVQDLIDAINAQVPNVTAELVSDGASAYNLRIVAAHGGTDFRLTDGSAGVGILEKVLNPDTTGIDTDISTLANAALASVDAATSVASDYTITTIFTPSNGGPVQRRTVIGTDGTAVTDLITNVQILSAGNNFQPGVALIYTNESSELNVSPATSTYLIGARPISSPTQKTTPSLNVYTTASNSGLGIALTSGTFTINGVSIAIDNPATETLDEIMGRVNSSGAGVKMEYDSVNDRFMISRPDAGNTSPVTVGGTGDTSNFFTALGLTTGAGAVQFAGTASGNINTASALAFSGLSVPVVSGTFTINGVKITANASTDTLADVIRRINNSSAGVIASYDTTQDRLTLTQDLTKTPLLDQITIGSPTDTSNFWSAMRLTESYQSSSFVGSSRVRSQFTVDGQSYIRDTNTVTDVLNDVTLTLKGASSDPIAVDISTDTTQATAAIRDFIVAYNGMIALVDTQPLSTEDRANLTDLTDTQRANMTLTEIDNYETTRTQLWQQEILHDSAIVGRMDGDFRANLFTPVTGVSSNQLNMLSKIGITTGTVGSGIDSARTAYLVDDTTNADTILTKLTENTALQNALSDTPEEVFNLFSSAMTSSTQIVGNVNIASGIALSTPMTFSVGNGTTQATVTFSTGYHSASSILSDISNALGGVGLSGQIQPYLTDGGFLRLASTVTSGKPRLSIQDLGSGGNMANVLGIASQTSTGTNASANAGLSRRLDSFLSGYVGNNGIINDKIKTGGLIDQDLTRILQRITDYEYQLTQYETRLRAEFTAMEVALAQFQTTSSFLTAKLNAAEPTTSSTGISLTGA